MIFSVAIKPATHCTRLHRATAAIWSSLLLVACQNPFEPPVCGPEQRGLGARGVITHNGVQVSANVSVSEFKETPLVTNVGYTVEGQSLKGHVTSLALVRSSDREAVLLEMTVSPPVIPIIAQGSARSAALNGLFDLVRDNATVIRIKTDDPSAAVLFITMGLLGETGWAKIRCAG